MKETKAIEQVSLADAADKLKAQIRSAFAELLTPEQWKAMIEAELKSFTKPTFTEQYGRRTEQPSVLSKMVSDEFQVVIKEELKKLLNTEPYCAETWRGQVSEAIKVWLNENATRLIQTTVMELAGHAAQRMFENLKGH